MPLLRGQKCKTSQGTRPDRQNTTGETWPRKLSLAMDSLACSCLQAKPFLLTHMGLFHFSEPP